MQSLLVCKGILIFSLLTWALFICCSPSSSRFAPPPLNNKRWEERPGQPCVVVYSCACLAWEKYHQSINLCQRDEGQRGSSAKALEEVKISGCDSQTEQIKFRLPTASYPAPFLRLPPPARPSLHLHSTSPSLTDVIALFFPVGKLRHREALPKCLGLAALSVCLNLCTGLY